MLQLIENIKNLVTSYDNGMGLLIIMSIGFSLAIGLGGNKGKSITIHDIKRIDLK
jgi:hypothetical protein